MVQFYLNGKSTFINNNIVIGDEPNFEKENIEKENIENSIVYSREVKDILELIVITNKGNIFHSFYDKKNKYIDSVPCQGTECKLGSIEQDSLGHHIIYIKKGEKKEFNDFAVEPIPVYTVFNTFLKQEIELDTSNQNFSFSQPNQLKL